MATRTIPDNPRPWWTCRVNGKEYTYKSGATVDVPDAVADVIDAINRANERPTATPDPVLPKITAADDGKFVKAVGGVYVLAEEEGGGFDGPLQCAATLVDGKIVTDKTAKEVFSAATEGRCVRVDLDMGRMQVTGIIPMEAFHIRSNGSEVYVIKARADTQPEDALYMTGSLAADDIVVLQEVTNNN